MKIDGNIIRPDEGKHFKDDNGNVYEYMIYLGIYDSPKNYIEITEEEYQQILKDKEEEINKINKNI